MANMDDARRKRMRCLLCIIAGVIALAVIIVLFVFIFARIRNPKVRFGSVTLENLKSNTSKAAYFSMSLDTQVIITNPNFGHYKFDKTTLTVSYRGTVVGTATIPKTKVRYRSTKTINVKVPVSSRTVKQPLYLQMRRDIRKGVLTLNGNTKLRGKVHLFDVFKRKKSAEMNCSVNVNVGTKAIQSLHCKRY